MKKLVFWLVMLLLLGYGAAQHKLKVVNEKPPEEDNQAQVVSLEKNEHTIKVTKDQIYKGNLLLVNKDHSVPPGSEATEAVNLFQHKELVKGFIVLDNTIQLSPSLVQKFTTMIGAAEKEGVSHFLINSGYRDDKQQNQLYQQMGAEYALPAGYSEHNLGLSLDIGSTQAEMNQAPEGKWLKKTHGATGLSCVIRETKVQSLAFNLSPGIFVMLVCRTAQLCRKRILSWNNIWIS
jgi:zinc D-Ala-D-Ala carboxypeptidase